MSEAHYVCPVCGQNLEQEDRTYKCPAGHSFDIAKSGYVNLGRRQKPSGDNREMVKARTRFLEKGYYSKLKDELARITESIHPSVLVDIGCGQGYYTQALCADEKYGFDLSKDALIHASKTDKSTHYALASIYDLPLKDGSADVLTSIFTPMPKDEAKRLVRPDGELIQVKPGANHLLELKELLYDNVRLNDEAAEGIDGFESADIQHLTWKQPVDDLWDLFEMTPYRYRTSSEGMARVQKARQLDVTFDFLIIRRKRKEHDEHAAKREI